MKSELFQHELGKTSAVFGRKHDVEVVFQGDGAATNGSTIILPALDMEATITDEQQNIMRGYVDHEAGHVRHSDFDALAKLGAECQQTGNTLLRAIHNALEDVWLERRVMDEYRGSESNLRATTHAVNSEFLREVPAGDERLRDDMFVAAVACTWEGRKHYGGETCQQCLDLLDDDLRNVLPTWIAGLDACRNSQDVIDLARIVEKSIRTGDYKSQQPQENDDGDTRDGGDDAREADTSGGDQDGHDDAQADGQTGQSGADEGGDAGDGGHGSQPSGNDDGDPDADGRPKGVGAGHGREGDEVYEGFDMSTMVKNMAQQAGLTNTSQQGTYRVMNSKADEWYVRGDDSVYGKFMTKQQAKDYDDMVAGMAGDVNVMRRKLERALVAKQQRDWDVGREQGRLDTRRLTSAYAGRTNVFKMRDDSNEIDTALTILIDLSGSMSGREAYVAQQCVAAIAEAIDRTGVKYEVIGFNNRRCEVLPDGMTYSDMYDEDSGRNLYGRVEPLNLYVFKHFDERLFEAKGAITSVRHFTGGHNTDGDALSYAYERLRNRGEQRKVCMVMSDGLPVGQSGDDVQHQRLRNVVGRIERDGVDCIGLGIMSDAVQRFYPKWVVVNDVEDLSRNAMDQLSRVLLGERFQIDNSKLMQAKHAV